jgi:hypothetical protein
VRFHWQLHQHYLKLTIRVILHLYRRENSKNYKFQEFQNLLTIEQAKVYKDNGESCISEKGISKRIYNDLRIESIEFCQERQDMAESIRKNNQ